ncbi:MAG: type II toxin-antitoxin system HipA family toxin [Acidimicrobiales bacterium]
MARQSLDVWLYDTYLGVLSEPRPGKPRLDYTGEAEARFRPGSTILSISMPIDLVRKPNGVAVRAFFNGLLPEGTNRTRLEEEFGVAAGDDFGLLAAIGRDCAGAVVVLPSGSEAPSKVGHFAEVGDEWIAEAVRGIDDRPLGADEEVRVSLAGAQEKLLLARTPEGRWARPADGAPSTHIFKPQDMRLYGYAAGEAFCLELAHRLSLTDVEVSVATIAGRPVLVVSRYDRHMTEHRVERIHQEDATQALAVDLSGNRGRLKYESQGGPSLRDLAGVLRTYAGAEDLDKLIRTMVLNVAVGNSDAHAKNFSILHPPHGAVALAPAYDVTPTAFYRGVPTPVGANDLTDKLGLRINGRASVHAVTADDLIAEAASWGVRRSRAAQVVESALGTISESLNGAADAAGVPEEIAAFVSERAATLTEGKAAGANEPTTSRSVARRTRGSTKPLTLTSYSERRRRSPTSDGRDKSVGRALRW